MESYIYLFLFVLQLVFTVVVLIVLLHERRLRKQQEKKNKQLLTELLNLREEIQAMINIHFTFTGKIARISESTMTASDELKKLISATEKLKKELERIKAVPSRIIRKLPIIRKQALPVNPTLSNKARKKKRLQTGVAYGRS
ncbi:hypothetical protein KFX61_15155 [Bacteroides thetaiotaomicron]|uniref:hypothetical protein n=1 Tax=Bacteroides thetaiotaomicron TaxID=818 RepID=UPI001CE24585|nr:hypothetical protein [Bacteroides thetaiotaomicron]MCA6042156.1 hypothetical protein [Bacteroides thetaiotaomicron]